MKGKIEDDQYSKKNKESDSLYIVYHLVDACSGLKYKCFFL